MDTSAATGGIFLLVFLLLAVAFFVTVWIIGSKGWRAVQRYDRNVAVRRDIDDAIIDEQVARAHARKRLRESGYEG